MAVRPVLTLPQPVLTTPARPVGSVDAAARALAADLVDTMRVSPGCVGLAAPQIGEPWRVVVIHDLPEFVEHYTRLQLLEREREVIEPYVLVNPVISAVGYETRTHFEGCLSVEGYTAAVERFHQVDLSYDDLQGHQHRARVGGWHARILQHEVDHLDGLLYVDRMNTRTLGTTDNYAELADLATGEAVDAVTGGADSGGPPA